MRVLFIAPQFYPDVFGGAEIFNYYFSQSLKNNNIDISIISNSSINISGIKTIKLRKSKPQRLISNLHILFLLLFSKPRPDKIILTYTKKSWVNWIIYPLLKILFSYKYIIIIHGGSFHKWKPIKFYKFFFKHADHLFGVSYRACEEYKKRSQREVNYLPPLIPFKHSTLKVNEIIANLNIDASNYILYVGSIKEIKGTKTLIDAFIELDERFVINNSLKLLIAGDGKIRKELEEKAKASIYNGRIIFLGNISREHIPDLFKISKYYVIPSQFENLSISLLESMYNEKPIIAANSPGLSDIIKDREDGLLFETNNPSDLKNKISELVGDSDLAIRLAKNARIKFKGNYDYQNMIDNFILTIN